MPCVTYGGFHFGEVQKRTFPKAFLALSRDDGTVRVHRDSEALCRCKSGTGPSPGITSASPGIVLVIAALDYLMCSRLVAPLGVTPTWTNRSLPDTPLRRNLRPTDLENGLELCGSKHTDALLTSRGVRLYV